MRKTEPRRSWEDEIAQEWPDGVEVAALAERKAAFIDEASAPERLAHLEASYPEAFDPDAQQPFLDEVARERDAARAKLYPEAFIDSALLAATATPPRSGRRKPARKHTFENPATGRGGRLRKLKARTEVQKRSKDPTDILRTATRGRAKAAIKDYLGVAL